MREKDVDGMEVRKERQEHEEHRKGRQRKHGADKIEDGKGGKKPWRALLVKWYCGLDGTEACTPVVPEHFVSHWNRQCETKRRAGKRANAKPMPADRFARLAKARHYVSSCVPRVGDVDAHVDHTTLGIY